MARNHHLIRAGACRRLQQVIAESHLAERRAPRGNQALPADGSTLKVTAPIPQSPVNNQAIATGNDITLVVTNASTTFGTPAALTYRFEIYNASGARVYSSSTIAGGSAGTTSHLLPDSVALEGEQRYAWRARAEFEGETGPWSDSASFIAPTTTGYIRGNELYDPLVNGKTIGQIHGPVTFIPGVGAKLESQLSYISYQLGATLTEGEFSILITGMPTNTEGDKTKLFAMAEGYSDIVTNDRRMTVEKRGNPAGIVAWRFITHDDRIETDGSRARQGQLQRERPLLLAEPPGATIASISSSTKAGFPGGRFTTLASRSRAAPTIPILTSSTSALRLVAAARRPRRSIT